MFFVVALLAFFVRLYRIDQNSLWLDELTSLHFGSITPLRQQLHDILISTPHSPLYFIAVGGWRRLVGDSETALRLSSVLPDCLSVYILGRLSEALGLKRGAAVAVTGLYALSITPIYFAQELRPYSLLIMLGLAFAYFSLLHFQGNRRIRLQIALIASALLLAECHHFGLLAVAHLGPSTWLMAQPSSSDWSARKVLRQTFFMFSLCLIPALIYFGFVSPHNHSYQPEWIPPFTLRAFLELILWMFGLKVWNLAALGFCICLTLAWSNGWRPSLRRTSGFLLWFATPILFAVLFGLLVRPIWINRYFVLSIPALFLLWGFALDSLFCQSRNLFAVALAVSFGAVGHTLLASEYLTHPTKSMLREGIHAIDMFERQNQLNALPIFACEYYHDSTSFYGERILNRKTQEPTLCADHFPPKQKTPYWLVWFARPDEIPNVLARAPDHVQVVFHNLDTEVYLIAPQI